MHRSLLLASLVVASGQSMAGQMPPPILDMHLHALGAYDQGPSICAPLERMPAWDPAGPYGEAFDMNHLCSEPVLSPATDEAVRDGTIAIMERLNIFGVLSGTPERVADWRAAAPGRFLPGLGFRVGPGAPTPDRLRAMVDSGTLEVLAEVTNQYIGLGPDAEAMEPYWAMAESLDLPVGIHMGPGPPGVTYLGATAYRASLGNPLLLEDVLARHPRLRVYVMHAGFPFLDEMNALLYAHPQVYVEVGIIVFSQPRAAFYRYLRGMIDAGFEDRIMFGSDQMNWPEALARAVRTIEEAPFLTEAQKRGILYENAARFLRLSDEERARHHGG